MRTGYTDALVKCPYFRCLVSPKNSRGRTHEIRCKGLEKGSVISQRFFSRGAWKKYREGYCRNCNYQNCNIYKAIESSEKNIA